MQLANAGRQLAQAIIGQYQDLDGRDKKITNVFCLDSDSTAGAIEKWALH